MSVPVQTPVTLHTGNGVTTVFAYQFLITLAADLVVTVAGVLKVQDVDYTVSGVGVEVGGNVTFVSGAPALAASVVLQRVIALKRDTDYQYAGDFQASTVNADVDRLWLAAQGIDAEVKRSIRVAADSTGVDLELPAPTALSYLRWNALATSLENVLLADISLISLSAYAQTLLDAVDAAAARSVLATTGVADLAAAGGAVLVGNTPAGGVTETTVQGAIDGLDTRKTNVGALRSYLAGCTLSTAGASATMSIAEGVAMDSANAFLMQLSAIAKTTSAWAVGTGVGGLDTGVIANSEWYDFYVIRRPDTGVVDVLFSLSAPPTPPTLPAGYTQYRIIGSGRTNSSGQWTDFFQIGNNFYWRVPVLTVSVVIGTSASYQTMIVPPGRSVIADINVQANHASAAGLVLVSSPQTTAISASTSVSNVVVTNSGTTSAVPTRMSVMTDALPRVQVVSTLASTNLTVSTNGWTDTRGRDA